MAALRYLLAPLNIIIILEIRPITYNVFLPQAAYNMSAYSNYSQRAFSPRSIATVLVTCKSQATNHSTFIVQQSSPSKSIAVISPKPITAQTNYSRQDARKQHIPRRGRAGWTGRARVAPCPEPASPLCNMDDVMWCDVVWCDVVWCDVSIGTKPQYNVTCLWH
jgi:hypothetical protein